MNSFSRWQPWWLNSSVVPPSGLGFSAKVMRVSIQSWGPLTHRQAIWFALRPSTSRIAAAVSAGSLK
jgi:hypothetical protein